MTSHYLIAWLLVAKRNCCASSVNKAVLLLKKLCGSKLYSKNCSGSKCYLINVKLINSKVTSTCISNMESQRTHGFCGRALVRDNVVFS